MSEFPPIDVWRMSASRPWQLEATHGALTKYLKYSGELRYHLIESVLVKELSQQCIHWAKYNGYKIHVISPAKGQGYAMNYALKKVIDCPFSLKWEDDFKPVKEIPLDICVELMRKYPKINQICFNKRETAPFKYVANEHGRYEWKKEQRYFPLASSKIPLVVKDRWWFGTAIWRNAFIEPLFVYWNSNTHNRMNNEVLLPLAGFVMGDEHNKEIPYKGRYIPTAEQMEKNIGSYIYGKTGDPQMVEHTGREDSIWEGKMQQRWAQEGKQVIGT